MSKFSQNGNSIVKVPLIMQLEALECGAACVAMILAYYNKWVPLEQIREDCGVSRDGSNAGRMVKTARFYGLKATGYRAEPMTLKTNIKLPCIIHWGFNHFVVLKGFKKDQVFINDPARGDIIIDYEEFDSMFTGICLEFEPGPAFVTSGKPKSTLDYIKSRFQGNLKAITFVLITTLISTLISILNPGLSRVFIDRLLSGQNPDWVRPTFIIMIILAVIQITAELISAINLHRIELKMNVSGSSSIMWKLLHLPINYFSQRMSGDLLERKNANELISNAMITSIAPLVINLGMMLFYILVMSGFSMSLTIIGVASILINGLISRYAASKRINLARVSTRDIGALTASTVSGIEMIETIKANGSEDGYFAKWAGKQAAANDTAVRFSTITAILNLFPELIKALADVVILTISINLVMKGHFTVGMILAFQTYMSRLSDPALQFIKTGQQLQETITEIERIDDVLNYPSEQYLDMPLLEDAEYDKLSGNIVVKDLTFGYSKLSEPQLRGFSMELSPGKRIAIVGASGSGKSTVAKLLAGLYKPWSGSILYDGKTFDEIDHSIFTASVAVVDQDITLFNDSISDNIKMWDESIEDFEVILAARDAQIHDDILGREGGYNYRILENGKDFSGGQRQRIEIARVLAQDPTVVILDEATSALDALTEYNTVQAISNRGIASVVIAHRISTVRDADEIIVLEHGEICERGTHEQLIKKRGQYYNLVTNE